MVPNLVWFCNRYRRILDKQIALQMINMHVMPIVCTSYVWSIAACRLSSISPLSGLQLKILHFSLWCKCFFIVCYFLYFWIIICLFWLALFYMSMKISICGIAYWLQTNFTEQFVWRNNDAYFHIVLSVFIILHWSVLNIKFLKATVQNIVIINRLLRILFFGFRTMSRHYVYSI